MIHEKKVVLLNLVPHQEENESQKGADGHGHRKDQRDAHYREGERLVVAKLEEPVVFVGSLAHPIDKREEALPAKVRHVKHLNAVRDENRLHEVQCDE